MLWIDKDYLKSKFSRLTHQAWKAHVLPLNPSPLLGINHIRLYGEGPQRF